MLFVLASSDLGGSIDNDELLDTPEKILNWFSQYERVLFYFALRCVHEVVCPWFNFFGVVLVKRLIVGKFVPGPRPTCGWGATRHWLMSGLLNGKLCGVTDLLGKHYDAVSWCLRLLGAKVGKRVYWPGSGVDCYEHDLLSVGDDAVFGSRSTLIPVDAKDAAMITIGDGCFVADRCVLLPVRFF